MWFVFISTILRTLLTKKGRIRCLVLVLIVSNVFMSDLPDTVFTVFGEIRFTYYTYNVACLPS